MVSDPQKLTEDSSLAAFYFSKVGYQLSKIFKSIDKDASKTLLSEANIAQMAGFGFLGLDGLISCAKYCQLAQKKDLKPYEANIKRTLLADISVKLGSASAGLASLVGSSAVSSALKSTESVAGISVDLLGGIFMVSYGVLIGSNLTRAYYVNEALQETKFESRIEALSPQEKETYQALAQEEKTSLKQAYFASNNRLTSKAKEDDLSPTQKTLLSAIESAPLSDEANKKIEKLRVKRNSYLQTALIYGFCLSVSIAMVAFPPSTLVMASVALAGVSLKIGFDLFKKHQKTVKAQTLEAQNTLHADGATHSQNQEMAAEPSEASLASADEVQQSKANTLNKSSETFSDKMSMSDKMALWNERLNSLSQNQGKPTSPEQDKHRANLSSFENQESLQNKRDTFFKSKDDLALLRARVNQESELKQDATQENSSTIGLF